MGRGRVGFGGVRCAECVRKVLKLKSNTARNR